MIKNKKIKSGHNLFLILILFAILFVSVRLLTAETLYQVRDFDSRIVDKLQTQSEVAVIVSLKANLTSKYSPSIKDSNEYDKWVEDMKMQVSSVQSKIIPFLSEDEFKLKYTFELSPSFSGNITKIGLEKLIHNPNVERID